MGPLGEFVGDLPAGYPTEKPPHSLFPAAVLCCSTQVRHASTDSIMAIYRITTIFGDDSNVNKAFITRSSSYIAHLFLCRFSLAVYLGCWHVYGCACPVRRWHGMAWSNLLFTEERCITSLCCVVVCVFF